MKDVEDHWEFDGRNRVLALVVGLSPIWLLLVFAFLTNSNSEGGLYQQTEAEVLAAQRRQLGMFALDGLLVLPGTVVLWRARSTRAVVGAICLLTLPAMFLVILGPAFVLVLLNAGT
jgi:uncharacterized membrane protein